MDRVRWEFHLSTHRGWGCRLNDHHVPFFARLFLGRVPRARWVLPGAEACQLDSECVVPMGLH